jgi:hypothetical protein
MVAGAFSFTAANYPQYDINRDVQRIITLNCAQECADVRTTSADPGVGAQGGLIFDPSVG